MQTDEYEISISREIKICKGFIDKLSAKIIGFEEKHGIKTSNELFQMPSPHVPSNELQKWQQTYEALKDWQQKLIDYKEAYESFRTKS